jgi:hypothetical protein
MQLGMGRTNLVASKSIGVEAIDGFIVDEGGVGSNDRRRSVRRGTRRR